MPKKLSLSELYTTSIFAILFNSLVDVYLDLRLDLYGYFNKGADYQMGLVLVGILPPFSMLFLNGFPFGGKFVSKIRYLILWSIISLIYDFLALKSGLLYYREWSIIYSALCYPPILIIAVLNLKLIRWLSRINRS
ncbi:CBO0543 family protein [Neobacillus jeddahensis]|uniref:CBO0543 family protein n=1 Tax=Neobacillus jeddahensis TaxID=1461580 RepID=UPI000590B9F4